MLCHQEKRLCKRGTRRSNWCKTSNGWLTVAVTVFGVLLQWRTCHAMQQFHEQSDMSTSDLASTVPAHNKCEPITISICKNIPYNMTIMPNLLGHTRQEEAGYEVFQFAPLVKVGCSPDLQFFLCLLYVPLCTILDHPIPPCRSLCESARVCESIMKTFRIDWPENLECSKFPEDGTGKLCVGQNNSNDNDAAAKSTFHPTKVIDSDTRRRNNAPHHPASGSMTSRNFRFVCPLQLKTPADMGYSLKIGGSVSFSQRESLSNVRRRNRRGVYFKPLSTRVVCLHWTFGNVLPCLIIVQNSLANKCFIAATAKKMASERGKNKAAKVLLHSMLNTHIFASHSNENVLKMNSAIVGRHFSSICNSIILAMDWERNLMRYSVAECE